MKTSLFISTFKRDFCYLKYCVRSINKFCRGFHEVVIQFPDTDWAEFTSVIGPEIMAQDNVKYVPIAGKEWPGKGMLWHEHEIVNADRHCRGADFIGHFDSDAIFTDHVTPDTFLKDGKPYLQYEYFEIIGKRHPGVLNWKTASEACLPFDILYETMRGLPHFYELNTYEMTRDLMMQKTKMDVGEYIRGCRNEYPQTFCEHVTLGNVAIHCFASDYELIEQSRNPNPDVSRWPVIQCWSHGDINKPQDLWIFGKQKMVVPMQVFADYGLC